MPLKIFSAQCPWTCQLRAKGNPQTDKRHQRNRRQGIVHVCRGMSQRDIADAVEDIYGFDISYETISTITDRVVATAEEWQNRLLKKFYTFLFVDCINVTIRKEMETKNCAVCVVLGYDADGAKDVLGLWIGEAEGKHYWMQIFDEIRARGVEDVLCSSA